MNRIRSSLPAACALVLSAGLRGARSRAGRLLQGQDRQHRSSASRRPAATTSMARAVARHIGKHIPGNPNVIVQNAPGRRLAVRGAQSRRHAAARRHRHRDLQPRPGDAVDRAAGNRQSRFPQPCLAWRRRRRLPGLLRLRAERREDLGRHDEPQVVHPRLDRQRRRQLHQRRDAAHRVQRAGAPDPRLSRQRRAAHRHRARRARRRLRRLCIDHARLDQREEGPSVRALLREAAATRSRRARSISAPSPRPTSSARSSTCSAAATRSAGRSSCRSRCRRIGSRSCGKPSTRP